MQTRKAKCSTYPCFSLPKPIGTKLNQARNQTLSWITPSDIGRVFNLSMFLPSKTIRNQAEPGTEPGTIMDNSKEYCSCTFEEPLGTTLNQARNQAR